MWLSSFCSLAARRGHQEWKHACHGSEKCGNHGSWLRFWKDFSENFGGNEVGWREVSENRVCVACGRIDTSMKSYIFPRGFGMIRQWRGRRGGVLVVVRPAK